MKLGFLTPGVQISSNLVKLHTFGAHASTDISCIWDKNGNLIEGEDVLGILKDFYTELYQARETRSQVEIDRLLNQLDFPRLTSSMVEGNITEEEVQVAIGKLKTGKAPGSDGLLENSRTDLVHSSFCVLQCDGNNFQSATAERRRGKAERNQRHWTGTKQRCVRIISLWCLSFLTLRNLCAKLVVFRPSTTKSARPHGVTCLIVVIVIGVEDPPPYWLPPLAGYPPPKLHVMKWAALWSHV